jgi:GTP-binding protein HflX
MAKGTFAEQAARDDFSVRRERALLVGVLTDGRQIVGDPLAELAELARSAGAEIVSRAVQRRRSFDAATCVGKGKLEEIRQRADAYEADVVIFDNELSPTQIREIEKATGRKVLDRSELILDIFASRARTVEARLQVELAQLEYTAPRLRGMWTHLERIAGAGGASGAGVVGGIGTRRPPQAEDRVDRSAKGPRGRGTP